MNDYFKLNRQINEIAITEYLNKLDKQKRITNYEAVCIMLYICRDKIGLRKTMRLLKSLGVENL